MTEKMVLVKQSLDTRRAALFVQTASKFCSKVQLAIDDKVVNAKSIMGTISLGISEGVTAKIIADGIDEGAAVEEVAEVLG